MCGREPRPLQLPRDFYRHIDIHMHVPEGRNPEGWPVGPESTIATSIVSALTRTPVRL